MAVACTLPLADSTLALGVQLAYALVTMMVYGGHFGPGQSGWALHSNNLSRPEAKAACGAAPPPPADAAVGSPDNRLAGEPLVDAALLPASKDIARGAQPALDGHDEGARPGLDSHDCSDGWELVGDRSADVAEQTAAQPHSSASAGPAQHGQQTSIQAATASAADTVPSEASGAAAASEVGGLRQRGGPASTSAPASGSNLLQPSAQTGQSRVDPADQQQDSSHVLWMCGHFTLQAWLPLGSLEICKVTRSAPSKCHTCHLSCMSFGSALLVRSACHCHVRAEFIPSLARTGFPLALQAAEKLVLAEGSKMVMVAFQSSYSQGVYGLVSNLGSLVVRTIFQVPGPEFAGNPSLRLARNHGCLRLRRPVSEV